jgi:cytidylate kinase
MRRRWSVAYLIVSGPPGSGKSTLAKEVASILAWPLLSKDGIKELLADSLGLGDEDWSHRLSEAAFDVMFAIAASCPDALLEANFKPDSDTTRISKLPGIKLQVFCTAPAEELVERVLERADEGGRHPIHEDAMNPDSSDLAEQVLEQAETSTALPLEGPILEVETTSEIDFEKVAAWVQSAVAITSS